jgi:hypothetical protein
MCAGTAMPEIPRIVIGENRSFQESRRGCARGKELVVADDADCIALMNRMMSERPELWAEDIGVDRATSAPGAERWRRRPATIAASLSAVSPRAPRRGRARRRRRGSQRSMPAALKAAAREDPSRQSATVSSIAVLKVVYPPSRPAPTMNAAPGTRR